METKLNFDVNKFKEMILYFASKSKNDSNFGAIKLNKLLFLADFIFYGMRGTPISGETYVHADRGPVPKSLVASRQALIEEGFAEIRTVPKFGYKQDRVVALRGINMSLFTEEEKEVMDEALHILKDYNATQASDLTHTWNSWLLTKGGEEIPYHTVFVRQLEKVSLDDCIWAKSLVVS